MKQKRIIMDYMPTEEELDLMYEEYLKNKSFEELFEDIDDLPF